MRIVVTGGCGFIGSAVVRHAIEFTTHEILNLDKMTYAASEAALGRARNHERHRLVKADINDAPAVAACFRDFQPEAVMHLAAESHVDRSIDGPAAFVTTNVVGTFTLLEVARDYFVNLSPESQAKFRFHHISTDEVFGSLELADKPFDETTSYDPRSPYAATKAASDHLARAWYHTYGLPVIVSNTSNNYGPWQFPEKLIPLIIINAIEEKSLPIYGQGTNMRDWLYVADHAEALLKVVEFGAPGQAYCIGARQPRRNIDVVKSICTILDAKLPSAQGPRARLMNFVADRPGHDFRYEIDPSYAQAALGWTAAHDFERGLAATIDWYLANKDWWQAIRRQKYQGQRLGAAA